MNKPLTVELPHFTLQGIITKVFLLRYTHNVLEKLHSVVRNLSGLAYPDDNPPGLRVDISHQRDLFATLFLRLRRLIDTDGVDPTLLS